MRELLTGTNEHTTVAAVDMPSHGGACHEYQVIGVNQENHSEAGSLLAEISFQKGPIKEHGVNGIHNEDLICIVIDHLEGFQHGEHACIENVLVLENLKLCLEQLHRRTDRRKEAGIEGTSKVDTSKQKCRVCGCTDENCSRCIEKTGNPCHWVEPDLCSACVGDIGEPENSHFSKAEAQVAAEKKIGLGGTPAYQEPPADGCQHQPKLFHTDEEPFARMTAGGVQVLYECVNCHKTITPSIAGGIRHYELAKKPELNGRNLPIKNHGDNKPAKDSAEFKDKYNL
jgi:hypothetical protein